MKTFRLLILSFVLVLVSQAGFTQVRTDSIKVAGECGMCKKKIENAAKKAGATYASWNTDTKQLTVKYNSTTSNAAKIEKSIAATGYDTPGFKATDQAYNQLDDCCKYERTTSCCTDSKCAEVKCMKDGKCAADQACCTDNGCSKKDCCTSKHSN